jgi:NAD(P)-dependent dehydrogenase (short-subunit alcohol dehydrogenase family)
MHGLTHASAALLSKGITVNRIVPTSVETEMGKSNPGPGCQTDEQRREFSF